MGLLLLLLAPGCASVRGPDWETNIATAEKAYLRGDFEEAERHLDRSIQQAEGFEEGDPRLAVSLNNLGRVRQAQGQYDEAESLFRRALGITES